MSLSIKINIANRIYPLTINRNAEENIRKSVKKIEERLKYYEKNYAIKDRQDLLAMCALSLSVQLEKKNKKDFDNEENLVQKLTLIDEKLSNALK